MPDEQGPKHKHDKKKFKKLVFSCKNTLKDKKKCAKLTLDTFCQNKMKQELGYNILSPNTKI